MRGVFWPKVPSEHWRRFAGVAFFAAAWWLAVLVAETDIIPSPVEVAVALYHLAAKGLLFKYAVASLFRVTWGVAAAVILGVPIGLLLGWYSTFGKAFNPTMQILRPVSPLAWIPLAILWFGVGDGSAIFIIFVGSFFPMVLTGGTAARSILPTHINAGRNFGLSPWRFLSSVLLPASMPRLLAGVRLTLGIAWLVVVAAEMIAVNSGLGFLIADARNAGNRYDLIVAGMVSIGVIGLLIDTVMRRLERLDSMRWGYANTVSDAEA